jgi:hypothetical protein
MSQYLEEAAQLLRKAAEENESENARWSALLNTGRERIAMKFAQLGAIEAGLIPTEMIQDLLAAGRREER